MNQADLHFDQYQFARRPFPVHVEASPDGFRTTGLDYGDMARTQLQTRAAKTSRFVPAFATSDEKLRQLLLFKVWRYVHYSAPMPTDVEWRSLNEQATKKALAGFKFREGTSERKRAENSANIAAIEHAGGYLEWICAIAYRSWRLRQDSVSVAEALECSPMVVRAMLVRLCTAARLLGYETFAPGHNAGKRYKPISVQPKAKRDHKAKRARNYIDINVAIDLRKQGMTYGAIAQRFGVSKPGVHLAMKRANVLYAPTTAAKAGEAPPKVCRCLKQHTRYVSKASHIHRLPNKLSFRTAGNLQCAEAAQSACSPKRNCQSFAARIARARGQQKHGNGI